MTEPTKLNDDEANVSTELDNLLDEVQTCIQKCRTYQSIPGISKLERKFRAEEKFLKRVRMKFYRKVHVQLEFLSSYVLVQVILT